MPLTSSAAYRPIPTREELQAAPRSPHEPEERNLVFDHADIVAAYLDLAPGTPYRRFLADLFGCSPSTISDIIKRAGLARPSTKGNPCQTSPSTTS